MKKPFANAYDAIKKLIQNLFGIKKKDEDLENPESAESTENAESAENKEEDKDSEKQTEKEVKKESQKETPKQTSKQSSKETSKESSKEASKETSKETSKEEQKKSGEANKSKNESGSKSSKSDKKGKKNKGQNKEKALEDVLANIAEEEGIKEEKVSKGEREEQKKYEEEVKKRAERKAKREAEDRKKEAAEKAAEAQDGNVKMVVDPVTGEEIPLGTLPAAATYLKKYMRIQTTSDDIVVALNSIEKHTDMPKNIVILGRNGFGTVKVGEDFARSFYEMGLVKSDKIAKTKAKQLNKMSLDKLKALKGGCLIIENAGLVSFSKLVDVIKDSLPENNDYVVILTGEIDSLANFFEENEDIVDSFIYLIDIHKIKERGMMHLAKGYVKERGYKADKSVYDKLKAFLKTMEEGNIDRFIGHIDEVIEKCDKREAAKGGDAPKMIQPEDAN